jgi:uncharacterized protein
VKQLKAGSELTRRTFLESAALSLAGAAILPRRLHAIDSPVPALLDEFGYDQVVLSSEKHEAQLQQCISVLMGLDEDSLLKPMRQMGGQPAPGEDLGGWYVYEPNYDYHTFDAGFAPAATFGQWVSALARAYAINKSAEIREKVLRLNRLYATAISDGFYEKNRFPAYCYDKLTCGLIDSHRWVGDPDALAILNSTTDTALRHMPEHAVEHGQSWRPGTDVSYTWDESYTVPENQFIAFKLGAGERYKELGVRYLNDKFLDPLAAGENVFAGKHAYSHVNSLCSAMQAYLTLGSEKYLRAAKNGFDILLAQSYVTGGWGPDELLRATGSPDLAASLIGTHASFETPCGSYAHFKLTRYLMRVTRDSRYGDSMERVMYNTVLGAKPLQPDGHAFYYSDYNFAGRKVDSDHRWPCCSGTLPQVAADYRINSCFRDAQGVFVNLYLPSTVRWNQDGAEISLTQTSSYPLDGAIEFEFKLGRPTKMAANFRIPAWAEGASIAINDKRVKPAIVPGAFASLGRKWRNGDRVQLELPMKMRLEAIDSRNPDTVGLLRGPLVLFPITKSQPTITRQQLLNAKNVGAEKWNVETAAGPLTLISFTSIADEQYSTYLKVSG